MNRRTLNASWAITILAFASFTDAATPDRRVVDAAEKRDGAALKTLVKQRANVNTPQPDGATAIAWAAHWDELEMADVLIAAGADVNARNDIGVTPLTLACTNGSAAMVAKLLRAGADAKSALPRTGETPLMTAAASGNLETVKLLLVHGADINGAESYAGQTALMWAVSRGHESIVQTLLEAGADIKARSTAGSTALLFAARKGNVEEARLLLDRGADANEALPDGSTALLLAAASGHEDMGIFLLEHGANPNAADQKIGMTPLHALLWRRLDSHTRLAKALLAHGANPNARLTKAPAGMAGENGPNLSLWNGATPFVMAARVADVEMMKILADGGADPSITTANGTSALMAASGVGRMEGSELPTFGTYPVTDSRALEAAKLAVQLGADVNATDNSGVAALHGAVQNGHNTVIQFLADHGANLNVTDKAGRTPMSLARYVQINFREHKESAELLLKLGAAEPPAPPSQR
jgi:ankyrin repeat protein